SGLVTNHSGTDRASRPGPQLLTCSDTVDLVAMFAPEHGLRGTAEAGELVATGIDPTTGLPVHSLYGERREPDPDDLRSLDALLFDIQDIGVRYATYASTLVGCMRACARAGLPLVILDRPNPFGGLSIAGNLPEPDAMSFVAAIPTPILHGMTIAEIARCCRDRFGLDLDLRQVLMTGWDRASIVHDVDWPWVPPSPNLQTPDALALYPGTCLIEATTLSEGRGTAMPFQVIGAPWVDPATLVRELARSAEAPGVAFTEAWFTPESGKHAGTRCGGVRVHANGAAPRDALMLGLHLLAVSRRLWPGETSWVVGDDGRPWLDALCAGDQVRVALDAMVSPGEIVAGWGGDERRFADARLPWLLYD
ncbi:MAG: DUF1343 domain-containing protein, partial [Chloroflexia bacterium]|nr:DUF1343 domain-containing protein [Chloroflexia bacterium]